MQHIVRYVYLPPISERITGPASSSLEAGPFLFRSPTIITVIVRTQSNDGDKYLSCHSEITHGRLLIGSA